MQFNSYSQLYTLATPSYIRRLSPFCARPGLTIYMTIIMGIMTVAFSSQFCMHEQEFAPMYIIFQSRPSTRGDTPHAGSLVDRLL